MVNIYNSQISKEIQEGAKTQTADRIPNQLADKVVPVMEVNPKLLRRVTILKDANSTSKNSNATIYTTPVNQDFYLTMLQTSYEKNATCDIATGVLYSITGVINGATVILGSICGITLTAQADVVCIPFNPPVKLDRNTPITLARGASYTVDTMNRNAVIAGYTDETSNA